MADLTPYQRDILIRTALGEARGQGVEGMADVIQVILNRANSGQFAADPAAVALQNKQFSTWNKGDGGNNPQQFSANSKIYKTAEQALDAVASGSRPDPTGGALYYHTPSAKPSWSSAVNQNGKIERNGHVFYPTHPVPPGDIPSVASLLDVRRAPPSPANLTPSGAAVRQMTSPSGGNGNLQTALNAYATREGNRVTPQMPPIQSAQTVASIPSTRSLTQPGAINASVGGLSQDANLAAALSRRSSFGDDPMTPANGPVVASIPSRPAFNGDPLTRSNGPVVATIPSQPTALPRLTIPGSDGSYAGQTERMPAARFNGDPLTPSNGPVVASFPTAGPTTRTVPTTRVSVPPTTMPRMDAIGSMPTFQGLQDMASARFDANAPDRLNPGNARLPANYGEGIAAQQLAQIGLPSLAPPQITPRQMPVVPPRVAPIQSRIAPIPASAATRDFARNGVWNGNVFTPPNHPITSADIARNAPRGNLLGGNILGSGGRSPLNILVSGSNTIQPNTFQGSNTGRTYTPGQVLQTANGPVVANEGGGFTNQATGQVSGHTVSGGLRYDPNGGPSGSGGFVRAR